MSFTSSNLIIKMNLQFNKQDNNLTGLSQMSLENAALIYICVSGKKKFTQKVMRLAS